MEKMIHSPAIIKGDISHHRFFPKQNKFNYKSSYIAFPISKLSKLKSTLFSLNKFNLFGLYISDYGDHDKKDISKWIYKILDENKIFNVEDIILVTHPRVLGYAFNPVSFWMCFDDKNNLIAVLSEVNNTARQTHRYLCYKKDLQPIGSNDWIESKKEFYVSPFMEIEGTYKFRFEYKANQINFFINYLVDGKIKLSTSLKCELQEFHNKNLLISFLKIPFATFKTVILIYYQALKLYFKSIKYFKYPKALKKNITIGRS